VTGFARHWGDVDLPPALLLHCSLSHSGAWAGVARKLSGQLHLIAPDLVGHGQGPAHDPDRDYHDQTTEAALRWLPEGQTHLIGHSFGATVALRLALDHPHRVASLTLIEPVLFAAAGDSTGALAHRRGAADVASALATGGPRAATSVFLTNWGGGQPLDAMPVSQAKYMIDRIWIERASSPALDHDGAGLLPRLGAVACPVLLIEGALSPPVIADIHRAFVKEIPQAARVIIPEAGHMAPITHPGAVASAIAVHHSF